jgi:hypothetical protein
VRRSAIVAVVWLMALICPAWAFGQGSVAGLVRDSSGAVLPGVTVEASSPALIERTRSAVTDGNGQYRIVDLRSGTYTVTFSLPGFTTVKHEGIELASEFTANLSVELRVGTLEETVTVTGESPIVDVQNAKRQQVLSSEVLTSAPVSRAWNALLTIIPGITGASNNVVTGVGMSTFGIHGGPTTEGRLQVDGINVGASRGGAGVSGYIADVGNSQEVTISTSGGLGEAETGGPYMNVVPRTGGNVFKGSFYASAVPTRLQGDNYTDELRNAGLRVPSRILKNSDVDTGLGGPILRDRLWYFGRLRQTTSSNSIPGMYVNRNAGNPAAWAYEPDLTRQARSESYWRMGSVRLTWQFSPRNKLNVFWDEQITCNGSSWSENVDGCRRPVDGIPIGGGATQSPETAIYWDAYQRVQQASWTSTVSSRMLIEAGFGTYLTPWGGETQPGNPTDALIRVIEQGGAIPGLEYRSREWSNGWIGSHTFRSSLSYVTGAHNVKIGHQGGILNDDERYFTNDHRLTYRFNNGVPNQLTMSAREYESFRYVRYNAFYVQDQSTFGRLTLQGALRYDHAWSYFPAQGLGPDRFVPVPLRFDRQDGVSFDDISPRAAAAYDLFGTGRTSIKVNVGRYLYPANNGGRFTVAHPLDRIANSTSRSWTDANRNLVPDCDLHNPSAQDRRASGGDFCGAYSNDRFGTTLFATEIDPALLQGWRVRPYDWGFGAALQQELMSRVALEVSYNRRWWNGFQVTDNRAVAPSDYDSYSIVAPSDPRLPSGGGYVIGDLYNISPSAFGRVDNLITDSRTFGKQIDYWHGVDVTLNARLRSGLTVQGGTSTGRRVTDNCDVIIDDPSLRNCHVALPFRTELRGVASYTIPRADVLVSGAFQSTPGVQLAANWVVPSAVVAQTLGRPLAGGAANVSVNLLNPGEMYGDRINQLDVRIGKNVRFHGRRANFAVDIYNALNSAAVLGYNQTFGPAWLTPNSVLRARFARFNVQLDF